MNDHPSGVLREPISGWEDGGSRGLLVGVYMGSSGLILKPVSGFLEFISRSVGGLGEAIRAFGDEVTRVPKTRIRSPRQYVSAGLATGKLFTPPLPHPSPLFPPPNLLPHSPECFCISVQADMQQC